jgi:hypothetical protein
VRGEERGSEGAALLGEIGSLACQPPRLAERAVRCCRPGTRERHVGLEVPRTRRILERVEDVPGADGIAGLTEGLSTEREALRRHIDVVEDPGRGFATRAVCLYDSTSEQGETRPASVAVTRTVACPIVSAAASTSDANRVFPTPAAPVITSPGAAARPSMASQNASSSLRPTRCTRNAVPCIAFT